MRVNTRDIIWRARSGKNSKKKVWEKKNENSFVGCWFGGGGDERGDVIISILARISSSGENN